MTGGHIRRRRNRDGSYKPRSWQARYPDPNKPNSRVERSFRTKAEAEAWLIQQQAAILQGQHYDPRRADRPFSSILASWQETWPSRLEPRTAHTYQQVITAHIAPEWGSKKVGSITHESVQRWVNRLTATHLSPATVRKIFATFRTACSDGVRMGVLPSNPCTAVRLPRPPKEEMHFLTAQQVQAVAEKISPRYKTLIYTAAYAGLRAGELGGLRRQDVDLLRGVIHVRQSLKDVGGHLSFGPTKTHERRTVSLPKFLTAMLREHLSQPSSGGTGAEALVFTSPTGQPLRHNLFYRRHFKVAVAGKPANKKRPAIPGALPPELHGLRFHDLRHTCAALSIAAGAHPKLISARLGHSSITITLDRYGHLFPSVEEALAERLDAVYAGAGEAGGAPSNVTELVR